MQQVDQLSFGICCLKLKQLTHSLQAYLSMKIVGQMFD